jgi:peptidoglycan/LPS O-acetylase OafA/YrhL
VLYITFADVMFTSAVAIVTVICVVGHGGWINNILSARVWRPLSRLSFSAFLIHPMVINTVHASSGGLLFFRDTGVFYYFMTHCVLSFAFAVPLFVCVEWPMRQVGAAPLSIAREWGN